MTEKKCIKVITVDPTPEQIVAAYRLQDALRCVAFSVEPAANVTVGRELHIAGGRIRIPLPNKTYDISRVKK